MEDSLVTWLNSGCAALIPPLVVWILASGLDDLVLVVCVAVLWAWKRLHSAPPSLAIDDSGIRPEKRIAIFIPLWCEHEVIGRMVEHNLASIRYRNYELFIGAYPNDEATIEAVRDLEVRFPSVHLALCPHDGPTSKGDCLNWILRRVRLYELENAVRYDVLVTHDAEDVVDPESLLWISHYTDTYDMVQVPVLPLATPVWDLTHGVYCDEFSEYQTKDMPVRQMVGGFIPSNGVGTGYTRHAVELLERDSRNRLFEPASLTEDYDNGLRLKLLGCRQMFFASTHWSRRPVATREYFPRTARDAVRQRTRWVMGIALQSWERYGWRGGWRQVYWLWRDRKGLAGNLFTVLSNLVFLWGAFTWIVSRQTGAEWFVPAAVPSWLEPLVGAALLPPLLHMGMRAVCVGRLFGWTFATGVPLRTIWANWLNCAATICALWRYTAARIRHRPLAWMKTEHAYPADPALGTVRQRLGEILVESGSLTQDQLQFALRSLPEGVRLGEYLAVLGWVTEWELYEALSRQENVPLGHVGTAEVQREACRALPLKFAREWKVFPFKIMAGSLLLAAAEVPDEELRRELARFTRLEPRFQLVTPSNFATLVRDAL